MTIALIILHVLYWSLGAAIIRGCLTDSSLVSCKWPHWFAAYFAGLIVNTIAAFSINQFVAVKLTLSVLLILATALLLVTLLWLKPGMFAHVSSRPNSLRWSILHVIATTVIVVIFVKRHAIVLWKPLAGWDPFLYHLPLGRMVSEGFFPDNLGRSNLLQEESAYPPLYFFVHGLTFLMLPKAEFLATKLITIVANGGTCLMTYYLARNRFQLHSLTSLAAVVAVTLSLNPRPATQSIMTVYFLLACYYVYGWLDLPAPRCSLRFYVPGIIALAGCYWCHYVGLALMGLLLIGVLAATIWEYWRSSNLLMSAGVYLFICSGVCLLFAPHMIRNWLVVANPVYPAFLKVFGGAEVTDWFLQNRLSGYSIELHWQHLPHLFIVCTPELILLLTAIASLCYPRTMRGCLRLLWFVIIAGFCIGWGKFMLVKGAPPWRFLLPVIPLALILLADHLQFLWRQAQLVSCIALVYILVSTTLILLSLICKQFPLELLLAFASIHLILPACSMVATRCNRSLSPKPFRICCTLVLIPLFYAIAIRVHIAQLLSSLLTGLAITLVVWIIAWVRVRRRQSIALFDNELRLPLRSVLILSIAMITLCENMQWRNIHDYYLPIREDIEWMNANLPQNAQILTLENRLFTLERNFFAADDYRLEKFYQNLSVAQSLDILKRLNITHIYVNQYFKSWPPLRRKLKQLMPYMQTLRYRPQQSWIAKFRY